MKTYNISRRLIAFVITLASLSTAVMAQYNNSSYFMEGMYYRHNLNPAFAAERNYINMPLFMLGNFNVGMQGNIGVDDFIYPYNKNGYSLTTFMNPSVDAKEFLSRLQKNNIVNLNVSMPIIAFGFGGWGGFNTFEIGLKTNAAVNLPYDLFAFAKNGVADSRITEYDITDLRVRATAYAEVALGHSRKFLDNKLAVGVKLKALIGAGNVDAEVRHLKVTMSEDRWKIQGDGEVNGSVSGAYFKYNEDGEIDGFDVDKAGVGGFGGAIDLGAQYDFKDLVPGLKVSAAILDLGFINWKKGVRATIKDEYTFDGFKEPIVIDPDDDDPGKLDNQIDQIGDDLEDLFQLKEDKNPKSRTTSLGATLNIGAEYALPMYKNLRFGFLSSNYINGPFSWSEARFSANVAPVKWFEASVNYGMGKFGSSFGWVLNFHPKGFNFFIGSNHTFGKLTPQGVPVGNANAHINLGFNITWGQKKI